MQSKFPISMGSKSLRNQLPDIPAEGIGRHAEGPCFTSRKQDLKIRHMRATGTRFQVATFKAWHMPRNLWFWKLQIRKMINLSRKIVGKSETNVFFVAFQGPQYLDNWWKCCRRVLCPAIGCTRATTLVCKQAQRERITKGIHVTPDDLSCKNKICR